MQLAVQPEPFLLPQLRQEMGALVGPWQEHAQRHEREHYPALWWELERRARCWRLLGILGQSLILRPSWRGASPCAGPGVPSRSRRGAD